MRSYAIAVFLIIFGTGMGMINDLGIMSADAPTTSAGFDEDDVWEIQKGAMGDSSLSALTMGATVGTAVIKGIAFAVVIIPFLTDWGVPMAIAVALQTPIWFIYGFELVSWLKGTQSKGIG
jgi:hypothetical protein